MRPRTMGRVEPRQLIEDRIHGQRVSLPTIIAAQLDPRRDRRDAARRVTGNDLES